MFTIVIVALNPGKKLIQTVESVYRQSNQNYEVIVKDGGSKDGSIEELRNHLAIWKEMKDKVHIIEETDKSIYDGMNQATKYASGEYLYFLNCGDYFFEANVLETVTKIIQSTTCNSLIYYGNIFDELRQFIVTSNPSIDGFGCYRNVPCHQACFYHHSLFEKRGYDLRYKVRGDYEHFLWCYYEQAAKPTFMPVTIATYEGGGFSETKENRKKSHLEHQEITKIYMKKKDLLKYKTILFLTLAPVRTKLSESQKFSKYYNKMKACIYKKG